MTTARCPACGASVAPGAPWCTLCYADLRAAPEPAGHSVAAPPPEAVSVGAPSPAYDAPSPAYDALGVRPPEPLPPGTQLPPDPFLDAPVVKPADIRLAEPGWPCRGCGARMPMSEDNCTHCHAPFLAPEDVVELTLPGVGNIRRLDTKMRTIVGLAGAAGLTLLLLLLAFIAGTVF